MEADHQILSCRLGDGHRRFDPVTFLHIVLAGVLMAVAVVLFLPMDTFDTGQNWNVIASWFSEPQFAAVCAICSLVGILGALTRSPAGQAGSATVLCLAHLLLALSFIAANRAGIGGWLCLAFSIEAAFVAHRRILGI